MQALDWRDKTGAGPAMTVSTGVACTAPAGFGTFRAFVNAADGALREATDSGNRVICDAVARADIAIREAAEAAL